MGFFKRKANSKTAGKVTKSVLPVAPAIPVEKGVVVSGPHRRRGPVRLLRVGEWGVIGCLLLLLGQTMALGQPALVPPRTTTFTRALIGTNTDAAGFRAALGFLSTNMTSVTNYAGDGAAVTNINADNISSGTLAVARLGNNTITTNKIDATFHAALVAGGVSEAAVVAIMATNNAATATTATNLAGGLVNSWREIYRTNQFGEQMADQLAFPLSKWVLTKKLFATNSTDAGGLRVSSCIVDPPYLRIYYAGYTNSLWNQVNSGGRIIMATATNWDGPWNKQVVINRGAPGEWDSGNIGGARVYRFGGGTNYLYYFAGTNTLFETDNQSCGVAYSTDGTNWTKYSGNPIVVKGGDSSWENYSVQGAQCVIQHNQGYIMYYGARGSNNVECIGMAFADNPLGPWTKYSGNPVLTNASVPVFAEPNVFPVQNGTAWAMLLGTGTAVSKDLTNWVYTGSPTIYDPLNLDEGVWFTVSPFVFSDDGYAALYDNAAGVFLARPYTAEKRVQYSGQFFGSGSGLTNVDAATAASGYIVFANNGSVDDSFWIYPPFAAPEQGLFYDINTNGWVTTSTLRAATYYGSGAGLTAIPASAMSGGSQGQVVTWHGSGAIWSNPPAGGGGGWTGNANQFAVSGGTTNIKSGAYLTNVLQWGTLSLKSGDGDDDVTVTNVGAVLHIDSTANPFTTPTKLGEDLITRSITASGNIIATNVTATGVFTGSGASLTALPAGQLTGTIPWAVVANSPTITTNAGTLTGLQVGNGGRGTTNATSDTTATLGALLASRIAYSTNGIGGEAIDFNPTKHSFNMSSNVVFTGVTDKDSSGTNYDEAIYFLRNTNTSAATVAFSGSWLFAGASTNNWSTTGNVAPTNGQSGAFTNTVPPGNMRVFIITHQPGQWTNIFSN